VRRWSCLPLLRAALLVASISGIVVPSRRQDWEPRIALILLCFVVGGHGGVRKWTTTENQSSQCTHGLPRSQISSRRSSTGKFCTSAKPLHTCKTLAPVQKMHLIISGGYSVFGVVVTMKHCKSLKDTTKNCRGKSDLTVMSPPGIHRTDAQQLLLLQWQGSMGLACVCLHVARTHQAAPVCPIHHG
jgi:hypothetical protein